VSSQNEEESDGYEDEEGDEGDIEKSDGEDGDGDVVILKDVSVGIGRSSIAGK
jgi:hypothetical protein